MSRKFLITIHLYLAAFMAPVFLLVAITGGLYLMGNKGEVSKKPVTLPAAVTLDFKSPSIKQDVEKLLTDLGYNPNFDYIKDRGNVIQTRPTSRSYFQFEQKNGQLTASHNTPNLQGAMMELHKGHGPSLFKWYQKLVALGLIFVVLSGFWLGISSKVLRTKTAVISVAGLLAFIVLAFLA